MQYFSTMLSDDLSVTAIYTALRNTLSVGVIYRGESHAFPELIYLAKGRRTVLVDGVEYTLSTGDMMIYAPGSFHMTKEGMDSLAYIISFEVKSSALPLLYNRVLRLNGEQRKSFEVVFEDVMSSLELKRNVGSIGMVPKENTPEYVLQKIKKGLEIFLLSLEGGDYFPKPTAKESVKKKDIERIKAFLTDHIDRKLSLEEIARGCSMSVSKLKLLFRGYSGGGAIDYFSELKIIQAKRDIAAGEKNFSEIAEGLGFSSLHYFSRQFKKITGFSPSAYKNALSG